MNPSTNKPSPGRPTTRSGRRRNRNDAIIAGGPDPMPEAINVDDDRVDSGAMALIARLDTAVDALVERYRSPVLDKVFYPLSSAADHSVLWHALGAWRGLRTGDARNARRLGLILGAESAITNGPVKALFRRVRPADGPGTKAEPGEQDGPLPYGLRRPVTSSFPSGHATAAFTAAVVLSDRRSFPFYFGLASAVAASRVYVRLHHASDVLAGAALGCAFGLIARRVLPVASPRTAGRAVRVRAR